jgi:transposase
MEEVAVVGIDLAKSVFQVHGIDARGEVVLRQRLRRGKLLGFFARLPRCLIGMETCASANYWARQLMELGHEVRLMPPQYVRPYVKRSKNDASDAEAICEAAQRPSMRFVAVKSEEQQAAGLVFRTHDLLVRQRTQLINAIRGHLTEYGWVAPKGPSHVAMLATCSRKRRWPPRSRRRPARCSGSCSTCSTSSMARSLSSTRRSLVALARTRCRGG